MSEVELVSISPETATKWLARNEHKNRKLIDNVVQFYANEMRSGKWKLNGDTIRISKRGWILDGQHRLHAIVRSNMTIQSYVIRGLSDEVFDTIDVGRRRGGSDVLSIAGHINVATLASAARWYLTITKAVGAGRIISNHDIKNIVDTHPLLVKWTNLHSSDKNARKILPAGSMAAFCLMEEIHGPVISEEFYNKVCSGEQLSVGNPAYELRERLRDARGSRSVYLKTVAAIAITIKAINAYIKGNKVGLLRYGAEESMPLVVGYEPDRLDF